MLIPKRCRFGAAFTYPKRRRFGLVTAASKRRRFAVVLSKTTSFHHTACPKTTSPVCLSSLQRAGEGEGGLGGGGWMVGQEDRAADRSLGSKISHDVGDCGGDR